jgi:GxxExxY protein
VNHRGTEDTEKEPRAQMKATDAAEEDPLTGEIIGAAIEVHRFFGPGLLESIYEKALTHELELRGLNVVCQQSVPVRYKGKTLEDFRLDLLVGGEVIVELKTVDALLPVHTAQLLTYLKLTGLKRGLLINFKVERLVDGVKRVSL